MTSDFNWCIKIIVTYASLSIFLLIEFFVNRILGLTTSSNHKV